MYPVFVLPCMRRPVCETRLGVAIQAKTRKLTVRLLNVVRSHITDVRAKGVLVYVVLGISI